MFVLTVTYPGGRTRQFSVRRERVAEVRRWLNNYQELKQAIEAICELNHELLRPERRRIEGAEGSGMIEMRRAQLQLWRRVDCRGSERSSRRLDEARRCGAGG